MCLLIFLRFTPVLFLVTTINDFQVNTLRKKLKIENINKTSCNSAGKNLCYLMAAELEEL